MKNDIDHMAKLWNSENRSMGEIATAMGITRSVVAGVISRNRDRFEKRMDEDGFKLRAKRSTPVRKPPQTANQRRAAFHAVNTQDEGKSVSLPFLPAPVEPVLTPSEYDDMRRPHAKGLLDLDPKDCRWPMGEAPYVFCCAEAIQGQSYCEHHYGRSLGKGTISERKAVADLKRIGRAA